jgi:hypothetical protein
LWPAEQDVSFWPALHIGAYPDETFPSPFTKPLHFGPRSETTLDRLLLLASSSHAAFAGILFVDRAAKRTLGHQSGTHDQVRVSSR